MTRRKIHMKKIMFLVCLLTLSLLADTPRAMKITKEQKKVVGYYTSWSAYSGFTPDKIDAKKLTHLNYAFANIDEDFQITLGDSHIDPSNIKNLKKLKKINPNLKILISVGGWSWSDKFSTIALTHKSRTAFANSCMDLMKEYGFDGIDIDWEFPVSGGLPTNQYRKEDKQNFTLLLKAIREKLDVQGKKDGKSYLLTMAGGAGDTSIENVELWNIHKYIDFANIMTYDIHGTWDKYTDFNAPLYLNNDSPNHGKFSIDKIIWAWVGAGFPKDKIVMGIPFFGKEYKDVSTYKNGLYQTYSTGSSIGYDTIVDKYLNKDGFKRYYHWKAMTPWLYNGTTFISYEDEQSIGYKTEYIKKNGLGGAMIWELSHDTDGILLDKVYKGLR